MISFQRADEIANEIIKMVGDTCEIISRSGDCRRKLAYFRTIDFVCVPKMQPIDEEIGQVQPSTYLESRLGCLIEANPFMFRGLCKAYGNYGLTTANEETVWLFTTTRDRFPVCLATMTGPMRLTEELFSSERLHPGFWINDGYLHHVDLPAGGIIKLDSERQFFKDFVIGGYVEPELRG